MNGDEASAFRDVELEDGEALHAQHPVTFSIPRRDDRMRLSAGQVVKLIFRVPAGDDARVGAERMWAVVRDGAKGHYVGRLDNQPRYILALELGDLVRFEARHVVALFRGDDEAQLPLGQVVAVEAALLDGEPAPPGWVYRVTPLAAADSGWRVYRRRGPIGERPEAMLAMDAGDLLDRLRVLDSILDMPVGTAWAWNPSTLEYDPASGLAA